MQKAFETKYGRKPFPNGSSGRTSFAGRNSSKGDRPRISRNVHANIDFSELDEVCLDVGKVDLSHAARFNTDLSPYKSRENVGDFDVSYQSVNGHTDNRSYYKKFGDKMKYMISCYVQLGMLPSKPLGSRSPLRSPRKKRFQDEDWKGWDAKISFLRQQGCPVVSVKECAKISHVLVMTEDLVDRECQMLEKCNGLKCHRGNFAKCVLGENVQGNKFVSGENTELKNKLSEYFADRGELDSFLQCVDCSVSSSKKQTNRQLDFMGQNYSPNSNPIVVLDKLKSKGRGRKIILSSHKGSPVAERFHGFAQTDIVHSNKKARKFLDFYTKFKNSGGSL